jgi:heptaprenyl diphosphate synthase
MRREREDAVDPLALTRSGSFPSDPDPDVRSALEKVAARLIRIGDGITVAGDGLGAHVRGGKQTRARIVLLIARLGTPDPSTALRYATAVELVHAGALLHDDLVDASAVRRSRPTVLRAGGAGAAIFGGLFLMAHAGALLAGEPPRLRRLVARALRDVARGQTDEIGDAFVSISPEAYLRRAYQKTGALYELAASLGAFAGRLGPAATDVVCRSVADIGLAFQLGDDLRDFLGGPHLGREAGTDLRQGIYTYPVLLTLAGRLTGATRLHDLLSQAHSTATVTEIVRLLAANGAFELTRQLADRHVRRAIDALGTLEPSPAVVELTAFAQGFAADYPRPSGASLYEAGSAELGTPPADPLPVVAQILPLALDDVASRVGTALQCMWERLPELRRGGGSAEGAAMAAAVSVAILELSRTVVSRAREAPAECARVVGSVDLFLAELFQLLANLPGGIGARCWPAVAALLADEAGDVAQTSESRHSAHAIAKALADAVAVERAAS